MWRAGLVAGLLLGVAACASTAQEERIRVYTEEGGELFRRGAYAPARDCFRAALDLTPADPNLYYKVAVCQEHLGATAQAEYYYRECLQRQSNHAEGRHALATLLIRTGRRDEARALIDDWLRQHPTQAAALAEDAWLREQEGDLINARKRLQQALSADPHDSRALVEMGRLWETMGRPERALLSYERSLEYHPDQPEIARRVSLLRAQGTGRPHPD